MRKITTIFLDDGGVLNDNDQRGPEWRRLVAEFFTPRLGGDSAAWVEANRAFVDNVLPKLLPPDPEDYASWYEVYQLRWLRGMAAFVGVDTPAGNKRCLDLAYDAVEYITGRVRSAYPGAAPAVRDLQGMGFKLFTASNEHSRELNGYLTSMGIREHFDTLYGADLINKGNIPPNTIPASSPTQVSPRNVRSWWMTTRIVWVGHAVLGRPPAWSVPLHHKRSRQTS